MKYWGLSSSHFEDEILAPLDSRAAPILSKLRDDQHITASEESTLLEFFAMQSIRSPYQHRRQIETRRESDDAIEYLIEEMVNWPPNPNPEVAIKALVELTEEDLMRHAAHRALQIRADFLKSQLSPRKILVYKTSSPLITSDEPLSPLFDDMSRDFNRSSYCCAPIVVFPLSSNQVVALFHPEMPVRMAYGEILNDEEVAALNGVLAANATQRVYGHVDFEGIDSVTFPRTQYDHYKDLGRRHREGCEHHKKQLQQIELANSQGWSFDKENAPQRPVARWWPSWKVDVNHIGIYIPSEERK